MGDVLEIGSDLSGVECSGESRLGPVVWVEAIVFVENEERCVIYKANLYVISITDVI